MCDATQTQPSDVSAIDADADVIVLGVGTAGEDLSRILLDARLDVIEIEDNLAGAECPYQGGALVGNVAADAGVTPHCGPVAEKVRWQTRAWDDSAAIGRHESHSGRPIKGRGMLVGRGPGLSETSVSQHSAASSLRRARNLSCRHSTRSTTGPLLL